MNLVFDTDVEEKTVRCDKTEIERCIINLVGNAVKFTPEGGLIEVLLQDLDDKVNEYEKKLDEYEKNNNRINELSELIESHNAMVISGRQVSEGYFKQIEEYKKELASMREIPHNKIMAYKRELAIAYKEKIKSAPEINKRYDETKEIFDVFNDINDKLELAKDKAQALLMSIDFSPEEIEMIDERLDLYYKFSNKYGKNACFS